MDKINGMLLGSFLGDAFALGAHWIYDTDIIENTFGEIRKVNAPLENSFHKGKVKGDFTHYGDQTFNMLALASEVKELNKEIFTKNFENFMKDYSGYKDHASKETISHLENGEQKGSNSDELGGIVRMSPIIFFKRDDKQLAKELIVTQTKVTHNDEQLIEISKFLTDVTFGIISGLKPSESIETNKTNYSKSINDMINDAKNEISNDTIEVIKRFGQSCSSKNAFPSVIYLILKYEDSIKDALVANVKSGGDSAARGMVLGMILGAYVGESQLPKDWLLDINKLNDILAYIS